MRLDRLRRRPAGGIFHPKPARLFESVPRHIADASGLPTKKPHAGLPSGRQAGIHPAMRRLSLLFILACLIAPRTLSAADGKIIKTLPELLDARGRHALSPSLYERDAYQLWLRKHPAQQAGLSLAVQWKAGGVDWNKVRLRAELRGVLNNSIHTTILEIPVKKNGWFSNWSDFQINGQDFQQFGQLVAWRVSLWEGDNQLAAQQSFLWSGVGPSRD